MPEDNGIPLKKRRLQNACDECKRRKVKCDSAKMPGNVCTLCLSLRTECTHVHALLRKKRGPPKGTPRGTKSIQSIAKSILSTSKPYVIPEEQEDTLSILKELASHVLYLEEQLEAFGNRERERQTSAMNSPDSSATNVSPRPMDTYYTPAYTPALVETENEGQDSEDEDDSPTMDLVKAVVKHLAISTPTSAHPQTSQLAQYFREPDEPESSTSDEKLWPRGNEMGRQSAKAVSTPARPKRKEFWDIQSWQVGTGIQGPFNPLMYHGYTFPPYDLLPTLVSLFFTNVHPLFPVLHKPIFEQGVNEGLHHRDTYFASVLLAVCALGSKYSFDPRVLEDGDGIEGHRDSSDQNNGRTKKLRISAGWKWFRQVRLIRTDFQTKATLYELQMYCLAIFFLQGTSRAEMCSGLLGLGVRRAQDLGIHRKSSIDLLPPSTLNANLYPSAQSQLWSRAFWGLITIDMAVSLIRGAPRAMHTDDFDLPLPLDCDDEYWVWERQGERDDAAPDQEFKQPEDKPSRLSYWVTFLKLLDIVSFAQKTLYAVRKTDVWTRMGMTETEWNEKIVAELDSALNAWIDSVPTHLKWDPSRIHYPGYSPDKSNRFFEQSTILYVIYYWAQIIIHKRFLFASSDQAVSPPPTTTTEGWRFPSMAICTNAARSAIRLVEIAQRRECETREAQCRPPFAFVTTILFVNVWRNGKLKNQSTSNAFQDLGDVYRCSEILRRWEHVSQMSGKFYDIFDRLLSSCGPPSSPSTGSYFTRGIRRGRDENDGEETTDGDYNSSGEALNPNLSRLMATHPRPVAGSRRAYNSNFAIPNTLIAEPREGEGSGPGTLRQVHSSGAQSYATGQSQSQPPHMAQDPQYNQFSLPIGSEELGNPLCDAGEYRAFFQGYDQEGSEVFSHANRIIDSRPHDHEAPDWSGEGGNMMDAAGSIDSTVSSSQNSNRSNEFRLDVFPSAFGNIGPEVSTSPYGIQSQVLGSSYPVNVEGSGPWFRLDLVAVPAAVVACPAPVTFRGKNYELSDLRQGSAFAGTQKASRPHRIQNQYDIPDRKPTRELEWSALDSPEDTLRILKDLARRVIDLEERFEAFEKREHDRQTFATNTPDSSVTNESSRPPMITRYTPAYTPTYAESENEGQNSGDESSTVNLVKAVVNQLAISTPAPAHLQTSELAQYLREPDSGSDGNLSPCGNSMGGQSAKGMSVPARPKRKEFWDIHSWQLGAGNQDTSNPLTYHGYTFPPSDLLPTLVSLFFSNVHPFFPVLHNSIFEQGVNDGLHHRDTFFASVLLVVCALGSRYSSDLRVLEDSDGIEGFSDSDCENNDRPKLRISAGWKWFRQIRLVRTRFEAKASLHELQMYCSQLWSRAFWGLACIDVAMSTFKGMPRAMRTDEMGMTETEWNEKIVGELDSVLNTWIGTIPAHLKWNPNRVQYSGYHSKELNPFFDQSTILYVTYYWAQIIVHKPFLSATPNPVSPSADKGQAPGWRFPSMAICTNAARSAVRLVEIAQRRDSELQGGDCRSPFSFIMSAVISSATTLFVNVWRARGTKNQSTSTTFQDLGDVYRCFEILRRWEHVSQVSGRFCDILNGMLSAYGLPSSSSMESYFTRGTRRGRDENDGEETSNVHNDLSGEALNPNLTRLIAAHPRPIAGSGRAYSSNLAVPNSSVVKPREGEERSAHSPDISQQVYDFGAQPYALGQSQIPSPQISHDTQYDHFPLPISSEELGSSLCEGGGYQPFFYGYSQEGSETFGFTTRNMDSRPYNYEASGQWAGEGGNVMNAAGPTGSAASNSTQVPFYSNETVPGEVLSGTFGSIGPEVFNSSYERQSQASGDGCSAGGHGTGSWDGWELRI
ncbi:Gypsy retrotransposon integrase-like protein 1 [Marasmius sp. AFHP31]|nr:Gypsy retrotransposon integrase-like protein 1 [Marasmius sp. AFHP31]